MAALTKSSIVPLLLFLLSVVPASLHAAIVGNLSGYITTDDVVPIPICTMVLASGKYMFSCNPNGEFSLSNLTTEPDGTIKLQVYADGFQPYIVNLSTFEYQNITMTRAGNCPTYNLPFPPTPADNPGSAGEWINIYGKVLVRDTTQPVCAMVLANGQYMFSCDGTGSYFLKIPLDNNGQFKLQAYADGFAPTIQTFDEFQAINDVRMARAVECQ